MLRGDLAVHVNSNMQLHTSVLLQFTLKLSNEVYDLKKSNKNLNDEISKLKGSFSLRISELEEKLEKRGNEIEVLNNTIHIMQNREEESLKKVSRDLDIVTERLNVVEISTKDTTKDNIKDVSCKKKDAKPTLNYR